METINKVKRSELTAVIRNEIARFRKANSGDNNRLVYGFNLYEHEDGHVSFEFEIGEYYNIADEYFMVEDYDINELPDFLQTAIIADGVTYEWDDSNTMVEDTKTSAVWFSKGELAAAEPAAGA